MPSEENRAVGLPGTDPESVGRRSIKACSSLAQGAGDAEGTTRGWGSQASPRWRADSVTLTGWRTRASRRPGRPHHLVVPGCCESAGANSVRVEPTDFSE